MLDLRRVFVSYADQYYEVTNTLFNVYDCATSILFPILLQALVYHAHEATTPCPRLWYAWSGVQFHIGMQNGTHTASFEKKLWWIALELRGCENDALNTWTHELLDW